MIEKRFKLIGDNNLEFLMQHQLELPIYDYQNNKRLSLSNALDLLNSFNDENDVLKQQLKTKYIVNKQYEELQRLKQENDELKQAIAETEKMVQSTYDELTKLRCFKKNILRIKHSCDNLIEAIGYD